MWVGCQLRVASLRAGDPWPGDIRGSKQAFRRLRDGWAVQVALDLRDLQHAVALAQAAAAAGARFIEVGDPLIKSPASRRSSTSSELSPTPPWSPR